MSFPPGRKILWPRSGGKLSRKKMAKQRSFNTKFWDDEYIQNLDPTEKLLFIYFFTNPLTTMCGVYEISLKRGAFDTGIDKDMVEKVLKRFEEDRKIFYINGWLFIKNFLNHQILNPSVMEGVENTLKEIPYEITMKIKEILQSEAEGEQGVGMVSPLWQILQSKSKLKSKGIYDQTESPYLNGKKMGDMFEKFWNEYPRKISKKKTLAIWLKLKPTPELAEKIIAAVRAQKQTKQWKENDGQFVPHPTTWLNQERWEDEIAAPQRSDKYAHLTTKA